MAHVIAHSTLYPPYHATSQPPSSPTPMDGTGTVTSLIQGAGISLTPSPLTTVGTISIQTSGVTAGTYKNANITVNNLGQVTGAVAGNIPTTVSAGTYTNATITVDTNGIIQAASTGSGGGGSGTVTSVSAGTGLVGGPITTSGSLSLANTSVVAGSYTNANLTVDAQGRIQAVANGSGGGGGGGGSGTVTAITTSSRLTVNGTSGGTLSTTGTLDLADTGVVAGVYQGLQYCTVNSKGQLTSMVTGNQTEVNVRDFGALCDGTTDDTTAFQLAINYAQAQKLPLFFSGACRITNTLYITTGLTLYGSGSTQSYLLPAVTFGGGVNSFSAIILDANTTTPAVSSYLHSFGIKYVNSGNVITTNAIALQAGAIIMNNSGNSGYPENIGSIFEKLTIVGCDVCINSLRASQWRIENCQFSNIGQDLFNPSGSGVTLTTAYGVLVQNLISSDLTDNYLVGNLFYGCYYGVYLTCGGLYVINNKAKGCYHSFVMEYGASTGTTTYSGDLLMTNNSWEGADQGSVVLRNVTTNNAYMGTITMTGNEFCTAGGSARAVTIADTGYQLYGISVTGNQFVVGNGSTSVSANMVGLYVNNAYGISVKGNSFSYSAHGAATTVTPAVFTSTCTNGTMDDAPYAIYSGTVTVNAISNSSSSVVVGGGSGVTTINAGTGLTGGPITSTGTLSLANTAVTAGSYTNANLTVDAQGRLTLVTNGSSGGGGAGTVTSITAGTGLSGGTISTNGTIALDTSGVSAGVYYPNTVDTYGRLTHVNPVEYYSYPGGSGNSISGTRTQLSFYGNAGAIVNTFGSDLTPASGSFVNTFQNTSGVTMYVQIVTQINLPETTTARWDIAVETIVGGTPTNIVAANTLFVTSGPSGNNVNFPCTFVYAWPAGTTIGFFMFQGSGSSLATGACSVQFLRMA